MKKRIFKIILSLILIISCLAMDLISNPYICHAVDSLMDEDEILVIEEEKEIKVQDIEISGDNQELQIGKTIELIANVKPANADYTSITYSSSNNKVAAVNSSGEVRGISKGSVNIIISAGDITKTITLDVKVATTSIELNKSFIVLKPGEEFKLSASALPSDADQNIGYKSSDNSVAQVDSNGVIRAKKLGNAAIVVNNKDMSTAVTVIVNEVQNEQVYKEKIEYNNLSNLETPQISSTEGEIIKRIESESEVYINCADLQVVTKEILKSLYQKDGVLNIESDEYIIKIYGRDIINSNNELSTLIETLKDGEDLSFVLNDNKNLPGKVYLQFKERKIKYVYLYSNSKNNYELLEVNDTSEIVLDEGGKYLVTYKKISGIRIPFIEIGCGLIVIAIGLIIYVISKHKYWFW